jgi:hypothetical protein
MSAIQSADACLLPVLGREMFYLKCTVCGSAFHLTQSIRQVRRHIMFCLAACHTGDADELQDGFLQGGLILSIPSPLFIVSHPRHLRLLRCPKTGENTSFRPSTEHSPNDAPNDPDEENVKNDVKQTESNAIAVTKPKWVEQARKCITSKEGQKMRTKAKP